MWHWFRCAECGEETQVEAPIGIPPMMPVCPKCDTPMELVERSLLPPKIRTWLPMLPRLGPPLPRILRIFWPWR
ncbi:hypothetical protein ES703_37351 [subsurface metagenome]